MKKIFLFICLLGSFAAYGHFHTLNRFDEKERRLTVKDPIDYGDTGKFLKHYIHEYHNLTIGNEDYPYVLDHEKLNLKNQAFKIPPQSKLDYEVFGWYPHWEADLYKNLNYSLLTTVAYFSYEVNPSNGYPITTYDWSTTPLIDSAKANGVKVLLTITNFGKSNNKVFLTNDKAIKNLIEQLKVLLAKRDAHGICLDFEGVDEKRKTAYAKFISLLSKELKKENSNYLIYMTVPSVDWSKSLEFETLISAVDEFVIMGYGYYGSTSTVAGPVAPAKSGKIWKPYNLSKSIDYYLSNSIPPSKLIMALPYYGSMWDTKSNNKGAKVKKFIGYRTYDYIKTKVEGKIGIVQYDSVSQTAWCSYKLDNKGAHLRQCWFDNDSTLAVKLDLIKKKKLKGLGIWALGYDKGYSNFWEVIAGNLTIPVMNDSTIIDSLSETTSGSDPTNQASTGFWDELTDIEEMLEEVTQYKAVLLFIMVMAVLFGGVGFVVAMFKPETRIYFFSKTAYKVYYCAFILLFILVILRWLDILNDLLIALILGFITGAIAIYFVNKYVEKTNKELP